MSRTRGRPATSVIGAIAGLGAFVLALALAGVFSARAAFGASAAKRESEARASSRGSVFMGWINKSQAED